VENTGYEWEEKGKKRDDRGEEESTREESLLLTIDLKLLKHRSWSNCNTCYKTQTREKLLVSITEREEREMKREKTGRILPVFADESECGLPKVLHSTHAKIFLYSICLLLRLFMGIVESA
jgi:hypothetical protein